MPRCVVERRSADGLGFPFDGTGRKASAEIVAKHAVQGVTWVQSYVGDDDRTTWCVYDAPSLVAIRSVAGRDGLVVGRIGEVRVLDTYFYGGGS